MPAHIQLPTTGQDEQKHAQPREDGARNIIYTDDQDIELEVEDDNEDILEIFSDYD